MPETAPPHTLPGFYWHFLKQTRALFLALFVAGLLVALMDAAIPTMIGKLIGLLTTHAPDRLWAEAWPVLIGMGALILIGRPTALLLQNLITQQGINGNVTSLIRWQSHWQVVRQGLPFFQEDFAGRIANRVMQAGPALRESVVQVINAVWYILVYGTAAVTLLAGTDWRLALPIAAWFPLYALLLRYLVPRMRDRSREASAQRSLLTGRIVDSYTNIQTVKLFARRAGGGRLHPRRAAGPDRRLPTADAPGHLQRLRLADAERGDDHGEAASPSGSGRRARSRWRQWRRRCRWPGRSPTSPAGSPSTSPRSSRIWAWCRRACTPSPCRRRCPTRPARWPLRVPRGEIRFERVRFAYGARDAASCTASTCASRPGEKVGLVGRSGAGKSTLVNLLLRLLRPGGRAAS